MSSTSSSADYGIDAPYVIRNLLIAGGIALLVFLSMVTGVWSGRVGPLRFGAIGFLFMAIALTATGVWMWWSSKYGKVQQREELLSKISWRGDESPFSQWVMEDGFAPTSSASATAVIPRA